MPVSREYSETVSLPAVLDWSALTKVEAYLREHWGPAMTTRVQVVDSYGRFISMSLHEAREEVDKRSSKVETVLIDFDRQEDNRAEYYGTAGRDVWFQRITFYSPNEATAQGLAAALLRRIEHGYLKEDSAVVPPATPLKASEGSTPEVSNDPWWKSSLVRNLVVGIIGSVIAGIILALIL